MITTLTTATKSEDTPKRPKTWPEWTGWERAQFFRQRSGLTQEQVAEKGGISRTWIVALESGHQTNPNLRALLAYCAAIGVPIEALL